MKLKILSIFILFFSGFLPFPINANELETAPATDDVLAAEIISQITVLDKHINRKAIKSLYGTPAQLLWFDAADPAPYLDGVVAWVNTAAAHGLSPANYHTELLSQRPDNSDRNAQVKYDILLSDAVLSFTHDLRLGRLNAKSVEPEWYIKQPAFNAVSFLQKAFVANADTTQNAPLVKALENLAPQHPDYKLLQTAFNNFQAFAAKGGWDILPESPTIRPGETHPIINALRQRIAAEKGEYAPALATYLANEYDDALIEPIKQLQKRYALSADGVIGPATQAALNMPAEKRLQQLRINLERWRWLPHDFGERHILVNLPAFSLKAFNAENIELEMRVVVGRADRQTPSLSGNISHLVINPYWNVPHSLAFKDVLPHQQTDPDYMRRKGIRVYEKVDGQSIEVDPSFINWAEYNEDNLPFRFRQDPGARNSLGKIKFMFPNRHAIYLHDTPSRRLFKRSRRYYSSGCVRVENPLALAKFALKEPEARIAKRIASKRNQTRYLKEKVPVYLVYLTAWADDEGLHFAPDTYKRDRAVAKHIEK